MGQSVTSIPPSPHGSRQYRECPQYMGTNHMPVYGGTNQVYAVTAGATVPAAFAGVHRNHHFDTIQRLHPLNIRRCIPLYPGIGLGYSSLYGGLQSRLIFHKKEILQRWGSNISFFLLYSLVKPKPGKYFHLCMR